LARGSTPLIYKEKDEFTLGEGKIIREGSDATIISNGIMVYMAKMASVQLSKVGIDISIIDMHTVKPLDKTIIEKAARNTGYIVTAEEHSIIGGLGGAVAEILSEVYPIPMRRIGIEDSFGQSTRNYLDLLKAYNLTPERIVEAVRIFRKKNDRMC
jgi:transketolase